MTSSSSSCVLRRENRLKSSGEIELIGKQDCAKNVAELNYLTARYSCVAMGLGTTQDSVTLREELQTTRRKVCKLASKNSTALMTLLKNNAFNCQELPDLERLYRLFTSCLEVLESQLRRTFTLQTAFPLHSPSTVLIHTGLTEAVFGHKFFVSLEQVESPKVDRSRLEREDLKALNQDVEDIHQLLYDMSQKMDVKPWATEPQESPQKYNNITKADSSTSESSSLTTENQQVSDASLGRRRRCVCLVSVVIVIVVVLGTAAGVCIPLLLGNT